MKKALTAAVIAAMAALSAIMLSGCMNVNTVVTFLLNP